MFDIERILGMQVASGDFSTGDVTVVKSVGDLRKMAESIKVKFTEKKDGR